MSLSKSEFLRELQYTIDIVDPLVYKFDRQIERSIIQDRRGFRLIAVYEGSVADKLLSNDGYWKKLLGVNTSYLPNKVVWGTSIVWFEFKYDYIKLRSS